MAGFQHPHITTVLARVQSQNGMQSGLMPRALHPLQAVIECALVTSCSSAGACRTVGCCMCHKHGIVAGHIPPDCISKQCWAMAC